MTPLEELIADPWFPFAGDLRVKALEPPVIPEPARDGENPADCSTCARADEDFLWVDELWRVSLFVPTPVPGIVLLQPRQHVDCLADMPPDLLTGLGPMSARIERAQLELGGIARVHVCKWGDGGAHFHLWFLPRPLGVLQLRGSMLPMWMDVLPDVPDEQARETVRRVGTALAADGGVCYA